MNRERQDGADLDHEHHRVLPLDVRPQHDERLLERRPHQLRRQTSLCVGCRRGWPRSLRGRQFLFDNLVSSQCTISALLTRLPSAMSYRDVT